MWAVVINDNLNNDNNNNNSFRSISDILIFVILNLIIFILMLSNLSSPYTHSLFYIRNFKQSFLTYHVMSSRLSQFFDTLFPFNFHYSNQIKSVKCVQ